MSEKWTDEELVEILVDWHKYAHGVGKIGYCNNDKCQAALDEIKARIRRIGMKIMRIKEGQIFCKKKCIGNISGRVPTALKLRIPAGKFLRAERCSGCDDIIDVRNAAKVIKKED